MKKKQPINESDGTFATPERAHEIALMDKFGLAEFTELTGVGVGDYGIYRIGKKGISLPVGEALAEFAVAEQLKYYQAERQLTLKFKCTPAKFLKWHTATRGTKAPANAPPGTLPVSEFPLAVGFLDALDAVSRLGPRVRENSVPAPEIIAAFPVKPDARENKKWWDERLRHPDRYHLAQARVSRGRAKNPSRWDPLQIAAWLIEKSYLQEERVRRTVDAHFPGVDSSLI